MTSYGDTHARIRARVWQAIAQQEIDVSDMDREKVNALVDLVADAALLEVDDALDTAAQKVEALAADTAVTTAEKEQAEDVFANETEDILWEGRPFLSISVHYRITDERIRIVEGLLGKRQENVELVRIQDLDYTQTVSERMFKLGDIVVRSHDPSHPVVKLENVRDPEAVYEILRRAVLNARKKHNFMYREEM